MNNNIKEVEEMLMVMTREIASGESPELTHYLPEILSTLVELWKMELGK